MDWFLIVYFSGIAASFLSSSFIITILICFQVNDNSALYRIYLTLIDLYSSVALALPYFYYKNPSVLFTCIYNSIFYSAVLLHGFWVLFISFSLYLIICKKYDNIKNYSTLAFLCLVALSLILTIPVLAISSHKEQCYIFLTPKLLIIYLIVISAVLQGLIFILVSIFYYKIRRIIKEEILENDKISEGNRYYCLRLSGYPILYLFFVSIGELNIAQYYVSVNTGIILYKIRIIMVVLYPLMNSLLYGYTRSFKKYLWAIFVKLPEYTMKQKLLKVVREAGLVADRVFYDLSDISETEIFSNK